MAQQLILFGLPPTLERQRQRALAGTLAHLLGATLDIPIEVRVAASYSELADELAEGKLDFAWLPPLEAMGLRRHCGAELVAQADRGGSGGYYSVVFVPKASKFDSLDTLAGKQMAYVHRRSTSGYLAAAAMLAERGLAPASPPMFVGSHAQVVEKVACGEAAAGATFATFDGQPNAGKLLVSGWHQAAGKPQADFKVLGWAGPIPTDTFCAWAGTTKQARQAMQEALTGMHKTKKGATLLDDLFGAQKLVPATSQDFDFLDRALERLALNG